MFYASCVPLIHLLSLVTVATPVEISVLKYENILYTVIAEPDVLP